MTSLDRYLQPTKLINSDHAAVFEKIAELTSDKSTFEEKAKTVFYFIRDEIRYQFKTQRHESDYMASSVLRAKRGFCTQKAILFCALARCAGIPAGLHFYDIADHSLPKQMEKVLKTNVLYHHGIAELYLNNRWIQYDATLDIHLIEEKELIPVEFDSKKNCLMSANTKNGRKHIEYIRDFGRVHDVSFSEIRNRLREGYPHLFK